MLYLSNPAGIDAESRRSALDALRKLHALQMEKNSDPQIEMRIAQYELAYRMQMSIPRCGARTRPRSHRRRPRRDQHHADMPTGGCHSGIRSS